MLWEFLAVFKLTILPPTVQYGDGIKPILNRTSVQLEKYVKILNNSSMRFLDIPNIDFKILM